MHEPPSTTASNFIGTWNLDHDTIAHVGGVFLSKSTISVEVSNVKIQRNLKFGVGFPTSLYHGFGQEEISG